MVVYDRPRSTLFGTRSLRRTKATLIYRKTGNLRAVQLLLGHTKIDSTFRYLGIEVDEPWPLPNRSKLKVGVERTRSTWPATSHARQLRMHCGEGSVGLKKLRVIDAFPVGQSESGPADLQGG